MLLELHPAAAQRPDLHGQLPVRSLCSDTRRVLAAGPRPSLAPTTPVLILANKVDLPHAATQEELWYSLGLDELQTQGSTRPFVRTRPPPAPSAPMIAEHSTERPPLSWQGLYLCSIFERRGYMEGFEWLSQYI